MSATTETRTGTKVLFFGDGDFSFSLAYLKKHGSGLDLTTTVLEPEDDFKKKYGLAAWQKNAEELRRKGANVVFGVDATKVSLSGVGVGRAAGTAPRGFHLIRWNFPYPITLKEGVRANRALMTGFLSNARRLLSECGEVKLALLGGQWGPWEMGRILGETDFGLVSVEDFREDEYPEYRCRRANELESHIKTAIYVRYGRGKVFTLRAGVPSKVAYTDTESVLPDLTLKFFLQDLVEKGGGAGGGANGSAAVTADQVQEVMLGFLKEFAKSSFAVTTEPLACAEGEVPAVRLQDGKTVALHEGKDFSEAMAWRKTLQKAAAWLLQGVTTFAQNSGSESRFAHVRTAGGVVVAVFGNDDEDESEGSIFFLKPDYKVPLSTVGGNFPEGCFDRSEYKFEYGPEKMENGELRRVMRWVEKNGQKRPEEFETAFGSYLKTMEEPREETRTMPKYGHAAGRSADSKPRLEPLPCAVQMRMLLRFLLEFFWCSSKAWNLSCVSDSTGARDFLLPEHDSCATAVYACLQVEHRVWLLRQLLGRGTQTPRTQNEIVELLQVACLEVHKLQKEPLAASVMELYEKELHDIRQELESAAESSTSSVAESLSEVSATFVPRAVATMTIPGEALPGMGSGAEQHQQAVAALRSSEIEAEVKRNLGAQRVLLGPISSNEATRVLEVERWLAHCEDGIIGSATWRQSGSLRFDGRAAAVAEKDIESIEKWLQNTRWVVDEYRKRVTSGSEVRTCELRSVQTLLHWVAYCRVDAILQHQSEDPTAATLVAAFGSCLDPKLLGYLTLSAEYTPVVQEVHTYLRKKTLSKPLFHLSHPDHTREFARRYGLGSERLREVLKSEREDDERRIDAHWKEAQRKQAEVRRLREQIAGKQAEMSTLQRNAIAPLEARIESADRERWRLPDPGCVPSPYDLYGNYAERRARYDSRRHAIADANIKINNLRSELAPFKSKKSMLERSIEKLQRELKEAEKAPSAVMQPLPRDDEAARETLFFLHMPPLLRSYARISVLAQQVLLPSPWRGSDGRWNIEQEIKSGAGVRSAEVDWLEYYNGKRRVTTYLPNGSSGSTPSATTGEFLCVHSQSLLPVDEHVRGPSHIDNFKSRMDGVFYPDRMLPLFRWEVSRTGSLLEGNFGRGAGEFVNPFAHVPDQHLVEYYTPRIDNFSDTTGAEAPECKALRWASLQPLQEDIAPTRGNLPEATQGQRPGWLCKKEQYLAFGKLRAYPLLELRTLWAALDQKTLPLTEPAVRDLVMTVLRSVGELDPETGEQSWKADLGVVHLRETPTEDNVLVDDDTTLNLRAQFVDTLEGLVDLFLEKPRDWKALPLLADMCAFLNGLELHEDEKNGRLECRRRVERYRAIALKMQSRTLEWAAQRAGSRAGEESKEKKEQLLHDECAFAACAVLASNIVGHGTSKHLLGAGENDRFIEGILTAFFRIRNTLVFRSNSSTTVKVDTGMGNGVAERRYLDTLLTEVDRVKGVLVAATHPSSAFLLEGMGASQLQSVLSPAVRAVVTDLPKDLPWKARAADDACGCFEATIDDGRIVYTVNTLTGTILVNGSPPGRLPEKITSHALYRRTFGSVTFDVTCSAPGCYRTAQKIRGHLYEFSFSAPQRSLQNHPSLRIAEIDPSSRDEIVLLDPENACVNLPPRWKALHSHWLHRKRGLVYFRGVNFAEKQIGAVYEVGEEACRFLTHPHRDWTQCKFQWIWSTCSTLGKRVSRSKLVGCASSKLVACERSSWLNTCFQRFEELQFVHFFGTQSDRGEDRVTQIHLPRFGLQFRVIGPQAGANNLRIESTDFDGFELAFCQKLSSTLARFDQYLLLKSADGGGKAKLLIPDGHIKPCSSSSSGPVQIVFSTSKGDEGSSNSVSSEGCRVRRRFFPYDVHPRFGHLEAPDVESRLRLATLYLASGVLLPERDSAETVAETAARLVKECWVNRPFKAQEQAELRNLLEVCEVLGRESLPGLRGGAAQVELLAWELAESANGLAFLHAPASSLEPASPTNAKQIQNGVGNGLRRDASKSTIASTSDDDDERTQRTTSACGSLFVGRRSMAEVNARYLNRKRALGGFCPRRTYCLESASERKRFSGASWSIENSSSWQTEPFLISRVEDEVVGLLQEAGDLDAFMTQRETAVQSTLDRCFRQKSATCKQHAICGSEDFFVEDGLSPVGVATVQELKVSVSKAKDERRLELAVDPVGGDALPALAATIAGHLDAVTKKRREMEMLLRKALNAEPKLVAADTCSSPNELRKRCVQLRLRKIAQEGFSPSNLDFVRMALDPALVTDVCPFLTPDACAKLTGNLILPLLALYVLEDKLTRTHSCVLAKDLFGARREAFVTREWSYRDRPAWLVFEVLQQLQIRGEQYQIFESLVHTPGQLTLLPMGKGKTRVILPMFILHCNYSSALQPPPGTTIGADARSRNRVVRVNILSDLLPEAYDYFHRSLTASPLGVRVALLPFQREVGLDRFRVKAMLDTLTQCQEGRGCLLVAPEHRLSLHLRWYDDRFFRDGQLVEKLDKLKKVPYFDILDECDEILRYNKELNYACGASVQLPDEKARVVAAQAVLRTLQMAGKVRQVLSKYGSSRSSSSSVKKEKTCASGHEFAPVRITADETDTMRKEILESIAQALLDDPPYELKWLQKYTAGENGQDSSARTQRDMMRYLVELSPGDAELSRLLPAALTPEERAHLVALRGFLACGLALYCLRQRHGVNYGVNYRSGRKRLAVPFRASDTPAGASTEYGQPDLANFFTLLAYYYDGLSPLDVKEAFKALLALSPAAQKSLYEAKWFALSKSSMSDEERAQLDCVEKLDLQDEGQAALLVKYYGKNFETVNFWLGECVFPRETRQFPSKFQASAWNLADGDFVVGFSGTNDSHRTLPCQVTQAVLEQQQCANGNMVSILLNNPDVHALEPVDAAPVRAIDDGAIKTAPASASPQIAALLQLLLPESTEGKAAFEELRFHALVDPGGLTVGVQNEAFARLLLDRMKATNAHRFFSGVVFFDEANRREWMILDNNANLTPKNRAAVPEKDCFAFFDEARSRGADLKLRKKDIRAAVSLGPRMNKDKLMQGMARMRHLDDAQQRVEFVATEEVAAKIRGGRAPARGDETSTAGAGNRGSNRELTSKDVLQWTLQNTIVAVEEALPLWSQQGAMFATTCGHPDAALFQELLELEGFYDHCFRKTPMLESVCGSLAGFLDRLLRLRCKDFVLRAGDHGSTLADVDAALCNYSSSSCSSRATRTNSAPMVAAGTVAETSPSSMKRVLSEALQQLATKNGEDAQGAFQSRTLQILENVLRAVFKYGRGLEVVGNQSAWHGEYERELEIEQVQEREVERQVARQKPYAEKDWDAGALFGALGWIRALSYPEDCSWTWWDDGIRSDMPDFDWVNAKNVWIGPGLAGPSPLLKKLELRSAGIFTKDAHTLRNEDCVVGLTANFQRTILRENVNAEVLLDDFVRAADAYLLFPGKIKSVLLLSEREASRFLAEQKRRGGYCRNDSNRCIQLRYLSQDRRRLRSASDNGGQPSGLCSTEHEQTVFALLSLFNGDCSFDPHTRTQVGRLVAKMKTPKQFVQIRDKWHHFDRSDLDELIMMTHGIEAGENAQ